MTADVPPPQGSPGRIPRVAVPRSAERRLDVRVLDPAKAVQVNLNLVAQPKTLDDEAQGSFLSCLGKGIES